MVPGSGFELHNLSNNYIALASAPGYGQPGRWQIPPCTGQRVCGLAGVEHRSLSTTIPVQALDGTRDLQAVNDQAGIQGFENSML